MRSAPSPKRPPGCWPATAPTGRRSHSRSSSRAARRLDTPLYCYRPLTDAFIRDRVGVFGRLPTYAAAAGSLAFVITPERLQRAFGEIEGAVFEGRSEASVVASLFGLRIASKEIALGDGLSLIAGESLEDAPMDAVWPLGAEEPCVLACLTRRATARRAGDRRGSEDELRGFTC